MKRIVFYALLFLLTHDNLFADIESAEIFPMADITIGMTWADLMGKYPSVKVMMADEDDEDKKNLKNLLAVCEIHTNKFWDTLIVSIEKAEVESLTYLYCNNKLFQQNPNARDYDKIAKNIKHLFMQLEKELGSAFEKRVAYYDVSGMKIRCAMYIWKRGEAIVAFAHSPVTKYTNGNYFECQLSITPTIEALEKSSKMATDSIPEDALLWADAMGEEKGDLPNRWVYVCAALVAFCAIAYLIRRKR